MAKKKRGRDPQNQSKGASSCHGGVPTGDPSATVGGREPGKTRPDFFFFLFGLGVGGSCVMTHNLPDRCMPSQGETMAGVYKMLAMPSAFGNATAGYPFWIFVYSLLQLQF